MVNTVLWLFFIRNNIRLTNFGEIGLPSPSTELQKNAPIGMQIPMPRRRAGTFQIIPKTSLPEQLLLWQETVILG